MDRLKKLELIQRSLGLRHKLKVHESMKTPESHEDMSITLLAKWELEDELNAVESILADIRNENVQEKRKIYETSVLTAKGKPVPSPSPAPSKKKPSK